QKLLKCIQHPINNSTTMSDVKVGPSVPSSAPPPEPTMHQFSWPFHQPVDAEALCIPVSTQDCIKDFDTMFNNCYVYNEPGDDIFVMAQTLQKLFLKKLSQMPKEDVDTGLAEEEPVKTMKKTHSKISGVRGGCEAEEICFKMSNFNCFSIMNSWKREHDYLYSKCGRPIKLPNRFKDLPFTETKRTRAPDPLRCCQNILKELLSMKHSEYAWPFYEPVNTLALGLHEYRQIIGEPMDLGTIKYANAKDFCADVRLMFSNCYRYNSPSHEVVAMAIKLQKVFEARYSKVPQDPEQSISTRTGTRVGPLSTSLSCDSVRSSKKKRSWKDYKLDVLEKQVEQLSKERQLKPKKIKMKIREKDSQLKLESLKIKPIPENLANCSSPSTTSTKCNKPSLSSPMTCHEKEQLKLDIYKLNEEELGNIFDIIYSRETYLHHCNSEDVELDIENLQDSTLRAMHSFIAETLEKRIKRANSKCHRSITTVLFNHIKAKLYTLSK
uniref:Bromodomain testis-specific protein n=1 Tax=Gouania willdenowi TaxID=441366 RepID=A0A8C5D6B1_GOUWI